MIERAHFKEFFMIVDKNYGESKKSKCLCLMIARETSVFFKVTA